MTSSPRLTYCTNVHPSEDLATLKESLVRWTIPLQQRLAATNRVPQPMPLGLYLSARTVSELARPKACQEFRDWLAERGFEVATLNCFPYGDFHGDRVKHEVFRPGWEDPRRKSYTLEAARVLTRLMPEGRASSISTVAGTFGAWSSGDDYRKTMARHLGEVAAGCARLEEESGRRLVISLEPEPLSTLETTPETVLFFQEFLWGKPGREGAREAGCPEDQLDQALRRHVGVCYDTCHQAVEFESATQSLAALQEAQVPVGKIQLSSALRLEDVDQNEEGWNALRRFEEPRYLHQTFVRDREGVIHRFEDLSLVPADPRHRRHWREARVHFHVPVDAERIPPLATTRSAMREALHYAMDQRITDLFEIETYTFEVFPDFEPERLVECLAREWESVAAEMSPV